MLIYIFDKLKYETIHEVKIRAAASKYKNLSIFEKLRSTANQELKIHLEIL